jgi:hypothetical protein
MSGGAIPALPLVRFHAMGRDTFTTWKLSTCTVYQSTRCNIQQNSSVLCDSFSKGLSPSLCIAVFTRHLYAVCKFITPPPRRRGHAVAQSVEALRYKPQGREFDSRCYWNFSLTQSFRPHYGLGVDSASNRNEYQEYFLGVKAAGA